MAITDLTDETKAHTQMINKLRADRHIAKTHYHNAACIMAGKQTELNHINTLLGRVLCVKTRACIDDRSQTQHAKIQEYFERISRGIGNYTEPKLIPLHCVSASKFLDFIDNKPCSPGFPGIGTTHIPQLRKTLVATTLKARHENAKSTLEAIEALVFSIQAWAKASIRVIR